jgi:hypothetical protein
MEPSLPPHTDTESLLLGAVSIDDPDELQQRAGHEKQANALAADMRLWAAIGCCASSSLLVADKRHPHPLKRAPYDPAGIDGFPVPDRQIERIGNTNEALNFQTGAIV